jgi:hypothetical protein
MHASLGRPWGATLLLAALVAVGCGGDGFPRHQVSGTVTHGGKAVERGSITFEPTESVGKVAPTGTARIEDGQYQTSHDQSPTTGLYNVRVIIHDMKVLREREKNPRKEFEGNLNSVPPYDQKVEIPPPNGQLNIDVPVAGTGRR